MNKLTLLVFTTITVLSSNAFAQENQFHNRPAQTDSVHESICPGPQSCCNPLQTNQYQTEPLAAAPAAPSPTTSAIIRTLTDQVAQENVEAIADNLPMSQQTLSTEVSNRRSEPTNVVTPATIAETTQWQTKSENPESTQSSHWPFPVNRWATDLGKQFTKLTSYIPQDFPQTATNEAVEPERESTPQVSSTLEFAEELELPAPRPTDLLLPQETIELSQIETPSLLNSRSPQTWVDASEYFHTQHPELSSDTPSTPTTLATEPADDAIAATQDSILAPAIASVPAIATTPIAKTKLVPRDDREAGAAATRTFNSSPTTQELGVASSAIAAVPLAETKVAATNGDGRGAAATRVYSKAGAGYSWAYSLLLLPLLGFFLWGLFRKLGNGERQQAMARQNAKQLSATGTLGAGFDSVQMDSGETTKRSADRKTELNWKEVEVATDATPSTVDFLSQLDVEPVNQPQGFADIAALCETNSVSQQPSSTTRDVDSAQPKNNTTTSAAFATGAAGVAGATALTGMAFGTSSDSADKPQHDESESVGAMNQVSHYRDDLTRIEGINNETQQAFYDAGYYHYSDIENANTYDLKKVFEGRDLGFSRSDFETWSGQAAMCRLDHSESSADCESSAQRDSSAQCDNATGSSELDVTRGDRHTQTASDASNRKLTGSNDAGDDLTRIHGIEPATAQLLRDSGITTFRSLHEADTDHLQSILENGGTKFDQVDPSTWTEQTRFALAGHWTGLSYWKRKRDAAIETASTTVEFSQATSNGNSVATNASDVSANQETSDDLTKIRGIGPATAKLLQKSGITSFRSLHDTSPDRLQTILENGGSQFKLSDASSWIDQSRFAMDGDWNGLSKWKTTFGVATEEASASATATASSQVDVSGNSVATDASTVSDTSETADDLTRIHGIGPATATLLKTSGITSFRSLHDISPDRLQTILSNGGSQFKLIDPSSWTEQARFATGGNWIGLSRWQTLHCVAASESLAQNDSRAAIQSTSQGRTNATTVDSTTTDDLTKIHGLGKASQKVLNENGVYSFAQVASMTSQQLDDLFAESQKRFQLVDKSTWPEQAQRFTRTESNHEVSSLNLEMEILDEIDSIREITADARTSSSATQKKKQTSNRD